MKTGDYVLIVEDDNEWRDIIKSVIKNNFDIKCKTSRNYQSSIKLLRASLPTAVILDLNLGNSRFDESQWGGWKLAELAKEKHIPLIIVTGYPRDDRISRAFKSFSVEDFFDKKNFTNRTPDFIRDLDDIIKRTEKPEKIQLVFISYSHKNKNWLDKFTPHLQVLAENNLLDAWDDTMIKPGAKWRKEIQDALSSAKAALLLVTPDFLTSEFIKKYELPILMNAAEKKGLQIFWVAVEPCLYEVTDFSEFQAINNPNKPLAILPAKKAKQEIVDICNKIKQAIK